MFVENEDNRQFAIRVIGKGDNYGRNRCLTLKENKQLIEFYDVEKAGDEWFDELGQFVERYYIETIMEIENYGLNLSGNVDEWNIDGANVHKIQQWIKKNNIEKLVQIKSIQMLVYLRFNSKIFYQNKVKTIELQLRMWYNKGIERRKNKY